MKKFDILKLHESSPKLIGKDWMLITSGNEGKFNTMTASWGTLGELWNKPVVVVFIRPQRYTFEFMEANDYFTLCFFDENYRDALNLLGTKSGRDSNKIEESGLTPVKTENGIAFGEGRIIIECKKLYADFLNSDAFIDRKLVDYVYPDGDFHKMYVGEIVNVWRK
ncbi:MAG: flavin reductase family protein [Prevotellaceae bacterium]|nr:flavin reductase family protein [Prevotellaceae bacterium]